MQFSVIIPTLNEEHLLPECIRAVRACSLETEIIVVDGGSSDKTVEVAKRLGVTLCRSRPGRGIQMNCGASVAHGSVLLFLHADTLLPPESLREAWHTFADPATQVAAFRARFFPPTLLLRCYAFFTRFDSRFSTFGDQGITARSAFFHSIGGFPDWPLFEDVEFLRLARESGRVRKIGATVRTSSRKFLEEGPLRQQLRNGWAIYRFFKGESPESLARWYYGAPGLTARKDSGGVSAMLVCKNEQ